MQKSFDRAVEAKRLVGEAAAKYVKDGMTVGLGTGSTAYYTTLALGRMVQSGLHLRAVPTSRATHDLAKELGIEVTTLDVVQELDLAIDGADEVDPSFALIKGGGGALLREKLVASAAREFIVVADHSKLVPTLGTFPLPVEVVPFGSELTLRRIRTTGCEAYFRERDGVRFVTDNGNYIADCRYIAIRQPASLHCELKDLPGVVETGLFIDMATRVLVSDGEEVQEVARVGDGEAGLEQNR